MNVDLQILGKIFFFGNSTTRGLSRFMHIDELAESLGIDLQALTFADSYLSIETTASHHYSLADPNLAQSNANGRGRPTVRPKAGLRRDGRYEALPFSAASGF